MIDSSSLIRLTTPSEASFYFYTPLKSKLFSKINIILPAPAELQLPPHDPTDHVSPKPGSSNGNT
ncbi:hypothetical protein SAMN06272722_10487 [Paenibacillus sp. RU5A]|nr:hypothetical protein SAMN06272722_10487 [Paenibacillus sp. RU5A]SOC70273.1 hypothetical protein SAMN05880581_10487 [Paenibacillus sp. RU26A]SOC72435.1 hypothetical protein SAMN05880586_10487 [Paenibacillus sp. RU5M]